MTTHKAGNGLLTVLPDWVAINSAADYLKRNGTNESNIMTIDGKPQGDNVPIFVVTGAVEILRLWGVFIDVTDVSSLSDCSLDLYDGTNTVEITDSVGTDLSGVGLYALVGRWFLADVDLALVNSDACSIVDGSGIGLDLFASLIVQSKYGVENVIRFNYSSDGGGCAAQIKWTCIWRSLVDGYGEITPYSYL
jgi:hypothetical protein